MTFPLGHLAPNRSGTFILTVGSVWNHRAASAFEIKALGWYGGVLAAPPPPRSSIISAPSSPADLELTVVRALVRASLAHVKPFISSLR